MMTTINLKRDICSLFEVHDDEKGVQRIVTPLEYSGSGDNVVVRVRPQEGFFQIDENGEAAFLAALNGGNTDKEVIARWVADLADANNIKFDEDEIIHAEIKNEKLIAPYVIKVAAAAQQFYSMAVSRPERQANDFREQITEVVSSIVKSLNLAWEKDVSLPIVGDLKADHVLGQKDNPLIIVAASTTARLLEAEVIHMQYRLEDRKGYVLAIVQDQASVTKKQYERAEYFTDKTVVFNQQNLGTLLKMQAKRLQ